MSKRFPLKFSSNEEDFLHEACKTVNTDDEFQEIVAAFHFLTAWPDYFRLKYGELIAISHLRNPDDPPDVIAHFEQGDLNIEVTSIDPLHTHQSNDLYNKVGDNRGRTEVPISQNPASREECANVMFIPGHSDCESVTDRCETRYKLIIERASAKFAKSKFNSLKPGVLLFTSGTFDVQFELSAMKAAFEKIHSDIPQSKGWVPAFIKRYNPLQYFVAYRESQFRFRHQLHDRLIEG